jgi:hypothetical protein
MLPSPTSAAFGAATSYAIPDSNTPEPECSDELEQLSWTSLKYGF